ncbi:MAG: hypothetical protein KDA57_11065 [Planctomycetales bacterium]|nr:hypothetical protein [Planctomycetales bacterium]
MAGGTFVNYELTKPELDEEYVRQGLDLARQQIERGKVAERDIEAVIAEAKRRNASSS